MSDDNNANKLTLEVPTTFPDLNIKDGKETNYLTQTIKLSRLKFKHLQEMSKLKPEQQIAYAMSQITSLSKNDLGELASKDAAKIIKIVYKELEAFKELAKDFWGKDLPELLRNQIAV